MKCPQCGAISQAASQFCTSCGTSLAKKKDSVLFWIALAFGVFTLVVIMAGSIDHGRSSAPRAKSESAITFQLGGETGEKLLVNGPGVTLAFGGMLMRDDKLHGDMESLGFSEIDFPWGGKISLHPSAIAKHPGARTAPGKNNERHARETFAGTMQTRLHQAESDRGASSRTIQPEDLIELCGAPASDHRESVWGGTSEGRQMNYPAKGVGFIFVREIGNKDWIKQYTREWKNIRVVELPSGDRLDPDVGARRMGCLW